MKAELLPLEGKYYGTEIKIEDCGLTYHVKLWNNGSFEPSDRELGPNITIQQWRENEKVPVTKSTWYPCGLCPARDIVEIYDSHFESRETHETALKIINAINNS